MINILKAFKEIWTYPLSRKEQQKKSSKYFGKNEIVASEFYKSLEVFSKSKKYSFK